MVGVMKFSHKHVAYVQINVLTTPSIFLGIKPFSKYFHNKCTRWTHALSSEE